ncbi:inovirus-type Gp2 protein [Vibrio fluvialis]|nr:inovirus-type Gp2 protein [Vibrio fluvialis]
MMTKRFKPNDLNNYLFRGKYRVIKKHCYDYDHLASLANWWEYLDHKTYRYTIIMVTLNYDDGQKHESKNITDCIRAVKRSFKDKTYKTKIPLHYVWKLEHRPIGIEDSNNNSVGYHYHIFLAFNREISSDTNKLINLVRKYWKYGDVNVSSNGRPHLTPETIYSDWKKRPLNIPIKNTQTEQYAGVFHHLSYVAKADPKQELPEGYTGDTFKTSQRKTELLDGHRLIKKRQNTIYITSKATDIKKNNYSYDEEITLYK